jgi:hypothetical protein
MPVQTCTKEKPASVLQHLAGRVELWLGSTHSIHRLHTGVNRLLPRICCLLSFPDLLTDLLASRSSFWFLSPPADHRHLACDSQGGG